MESRGLQSRRVIRTVWVNGMAGPEIRGDSNSGVKPPGLRVG